MPILEAIEGRFEDICVTPDGREMLRFDTVFKGVENIREAQVVQEAIEVIYYLRRSVRGFNSSDIQTLKSNMELHVGSGTVPRGKMYRRNTPQSLGQIQGGYL